MTDPLERGATAVITHRVRPGHEAEYDRWLEAISSAARRWPGHLDVQIVRPVAGVTRTHVVVLRFQDRAHLERWMGSEERRSFIRQVLPILEAEDRFTIRSGLDFWFAPEGAEAQVPVRWKQALLTWSAIYPLVCLTPLLVLPVLRALRLPALPVLDTLVTTLVIVVLMVYVVMPRYTRLVRSWLFRRSP